MTRSRIIGLFVLVSTLSPSFALAQNKAAQETTITGGTLVVVAYLALWAMLLVYLAVLSARQKRLDDEIDELEKRLDTILGIDE